MEVRRTLKVECPYCGHVNEIKTMYQDIKGIQDGKPVVLTCDLEEGGCDVPFVFQVNWEPVIKTAKIDAQSVKVSR